MSWDSHARSGETSQVDQLMVGDAKSLCDPLCVGYVVHTLQMFVAETLTFVIL